MEKMEHMSGVTVNGFRCLRCNHTWIPRKLSPEPRSEPKTCPRCHSPYWNVQYIREPGKRTPKRKLKE
jgi:NAD-dependent SIR2 family protein deacetylase